MTVRTALTAPDPNEPRKRKAKRNVNGEGNIRQRPDGRWEGRAYVNTTDGREVRRSVYGQTWEEAHDRLTKLQAGQMMGVRLPTTTSTVGEYLDFWLNEIVRGRVRPTTFQSYEYMTRTYLVRALGKKRLTKLRGVDIRQAFNRVKLTCQCCALGKDHAREERAAQLRAQQAARKPRKNARKIVGARCCAKTPPECCRSLVADGTIRYLHRILRAALQDAVAEDVLTQNAAKNVRLSQRYRPRFVPWSGDEARSFLAVARRDRLYALYAVALSLGLRRGEALGLRWEDVDLEGAVVRVRQALHRVNRRLELGPVKTDGSERAVALPEACCAALRRHRELQEAERHGAGNAWKDHNLVFATKIGTPIDPRNINRHFEELCTAAGVRRIRFHDLRHSCATLLYEQGVPIENIQDVLGHSSPTITKLIYIEVTERVQRAAVDRLDYLFEEPEG